MADHSPGCRAFGASASALGRLLLPRLSLLGRLAGIAIILFGWGEVDALGRMFFGSYWATDLIIRAERLIFGGSSTAWFRNWHRPWLDELMAIFYTGYYLFLILASLPLFIKKKYEQTLAVLSLGTCVLFANYFLFYLFPVLSPIMADSPDLPGGATFSGYAFGAFIRFVQAHGAVRGGTFPSSHISEALIWSLAAFRYNRKLGAVLLVDVPHRREVGDEPGEPEDQRQGQQEIHEQHDVAPPADGLLVFAGDEDERDHPHQRSKEDDAQNVIVIELHLLPRAESSAITSESSNTPKTPAPPR